MGERFVELLVNQIKRLHPALGHLRRRYTMPPRDDELSDAYSEE